MNKTFVMNEIDEILDVYCEGCFLKNQLSKEKGKTGTSSFVSQRVQLGNSFSILRVRK